MGAMSASGAFTRRAAEVVRTYRPSLIYERYALFGTAGVAIADELGVPLVLEVNTSFTDERGADRRQAFHDEVDAVEKEILARASVVIAVTGDVARWAEARGVPADRIAVVWHGIDDDSWRTAAERVLDLVAATAPWSDRAS